MFGAALGPQARNTKVKHSQICDLVDLARSVRLSFILNVKRIRGTRKYLIMLPVTSQLRLEIAGPICEPVGIHTGGRNTTEICVNLGIGTIVTERRDSKCCFDQFEIQERTILDELIHKIGRASCRGRESNQMV